MGIFFFCLLLALAVVSGQETPPNILFLLTDDQDVTAHSLDYMPRLNKLLRSEGMEFKNYFVPTGLCCPSRSTILRGQYCHNTKIFDNGDLNNKTYLSGGIKKFMAMEEEKSTTGKLLQAAGYQTALVGKYLNGYSDNLASHVPPGWDKWMGMTSTAYFGPHFSNEGKLEKENKDVYQTDFIRNWTINYLKNVRKPDKPFFLYVAPFAPHAPALPAKRHANMFNDLKAPRYDSYNPSDSVQKMKPSWIKSLPPMTSDQMAATDDLFRNRLRSLQAVDEMLEDIVNTLSELKLSDSTYLFYMGDNGQHLGDFRITPGKRQAYDTDILVPFLVRGPGIKGGVNATEVVQSVDLLPTWLDLAKGNISDPSQLDGKSIVPLLKGDLPASPAVNTFRSVAVAEMYGGSSTMAAKVYKGLPSFEKSRFWNNTYQAVRVINGSDWAAGVNWMYAEWCTGERELYDSNKDPHQVNNLINSTDPSVLDKLSLLVAKLGSCVAKDCYTISFEDIAEEAKNRKSDARRLMCHNPPDMPGNEMESWEYAGRFPIDFKYGFPYSDEEFVPEEALEEWMEYENIRAL
jgi:arylsulfatase A-like enzyme